QTHQRYVEAMVFSPEGKTLATGDVSTIKLWDVDTRRKVATLTDQHVQFIFFSPDGNTLASQGTDGNLKLWSLKTEQVISTIEAKPSEHSASFSPDGKTLAAFTWDGAIRLWDVATRRVLITLQGQSFGFSEIAYSPDGRILASGVNDNTVKLWDTA